MVDHTLLAPLDTLDSNATPKCPLCNNRTKLKQLRGHIGQHVLFHSRGMEDNLPRKVRVLETPSSNSCSLVCQIGDNPCGFCGASGCTTHLATQGKKQQVKSNCHFYSPFKYGSAKKSTASSPCTNIPIYCPHCKKTIWKYNAVDHVITNHSGLDTSGLGGQFVIDIQIQEQEERWMKISPELTDKYRNEHRHLFLSEEELSVVKSEVEQEHGRTKKRSHGATGTSMNKRQHR